jgi:hypothetical protein
LEGLVGIYVWALLYFFLNCHLCTKMLIPVLEPGTGVRCIPKILSWLLFWCSFPYVGACRCKYHGLCTILTIVMVTIFLTEIVCTHCYYVWVFSHRPLPTHKISMISSKVCWRFHIYTKKKHIWFYYYDDNNK